MEALVVICFLFLSLKRNLAESSTLKRGEAGRPVPSITISVPKPSFAPSAAADKISTLHKTGYYHCFSITWNLTPDSYVNIYRKYFFLFLSSASKAELSHRKAVLFRQEYRVSLRNHFTLLNSLFSSILSSFTDTPFVNLFVLLTKKMI